MKNHIETEVEDYTGCLASGQCPKNQLSKAYYVKLKTLTEFGQELQIDFTGKLYFQKKRDVQILIEVDRFTEWPTNKTLKDLRKMILENIGDCVVEKLTCENKVIETLKMLKYFMVSVELREAAL